MDTEEMEKRRDVAGLIGVLARNEITACINAKMALVRIGEAAVEPLIKSLKDKNEGVRRWAAETLGDIGDPRAVDPLVAAMNDEYHPLGKAAWALATLRDPRAVEALIKALGHKDLGVVWSAADALARIRDTRAIEPLIAMLTHKDVQVRKNAIRSLSNMGDPRAVEPLIARLTDEEWMVRSNAAWALGVISKAIEDNDLLVQMDSALVKALKDPYSEDRGYPNPTYPVREEAANALKNLRGED
jgi:HEAT repeat protein